MKLTGNARALAIRVHRPYVAGMRSGSPKYLSRDSKEKWDTNSILLKDCEFGQPIALKEVFGNCRPVEVEIGSGKGTFLLARAAARPELNFFGVEYARTYCNYAADRMRRHCLANVRMVNMNAGDFFKNHLGCQSILRVHIYFPDPWPKRRHHRRRLIQAAFIAQVRRVLQIGGQLIVVTDHLGYFEHIQRVLTTTGGFIKVQMPPMINPNGEIIGTNFERKYIAQGRTFYSVALLHF